MTGWALISMKNQDSLETSQKVVRNEIIEHCSQFSFVENDTHPIGNETRVPHLVMKYMP